MRTLDRPSDRPLPLPSFLRRPLRATVALGIVALAAGACELDLQNPNSPTEEEVVTDADGIVSLAVGMQGQFASQVDELIQASALVTDEWGTDTRSLASYRTLFLGPPDQVENTFAVVEEPWSAAYQVVKSANTLLAGVPESDLGPGLEAGILSLANLFKGMALGTLAQQFERLPIDVTVEGPTPVDRQQAFQEAIRLLEAARSALQGVSSDQLAGFRSRVLGPDLDLENTIDAMLARYHLFLGEYQEAIDAASRVDAAVLSALTYTSTNRNPVENLIFQLQYVAPLASFVDEAEDGDGRPAYWVDVAAAPHGGNPPDTLLLPHTRYASPTASFPVYLPDEMRLVRAEANARLGNLSAARELVNAVRTQTSSPVDEPVAGLDPLPEEALDTEEELIAQIAYERRYELYNQGLRWEDVRRLGAEVTTSPTIDFLPLPQQECVANPSKPCG